MEITHIASFLVSPGKNLENPPDVKGTMLHPKGNLYTTLSEVFEKSERECNIPIRFLMAEDGKQENEMRERIIAFIKTPTVHKGKAIAKWMRDCTTPKSGPALFFIILGRKGNHVKIVLSRFPADQGITALPLKRSLRVEYIERVFMKNAETYKAAYYQDTSLRGGFWKGSAVDKQANDIANYWIRNFLKSDFETTSKAGTKRMATAIREASRKAANLDTKKELFALATLARGMAGQSISINQMADRYELSTEVRELITSQLAYPELAGDVFILDFEEYSKSVAYSSIELDNGGILSAPPDKFESCFRRKLLNHDPNHVRFTTEGRIVDERIKGRK